ncbi:unnamed protein product [Brachionus calyciflorus]|uniref:Palmitoyltransferase n=1 Tax=Brachionus calyciflorus TaxID=104777 RepID=A0A813M4L9_9BILA|nr:unnamed protein product [Brachionus calyciflorus]
MENVCLNNCVRFTKWIPVIFISCVIGWSYYAYIVQLCLLCIDQMSKKVIYIFLYHIFLIMFTWSYFQTIFTPIEKPSNEFYLRDTDIYQMEISENELAKKSVIDKKAKDLPLLTRTSTGGARYCDKCKCIKPDRSHHCGVCQTCVLKMDHHCPWVNNCVGYSNYKFFILFLFYAVLYCLYIFATSLEYFIKFWNEIQSFQAGKFHLLLLFFVAIMFGISIFTLLAYHIYLLSRNCTTLESFRAPIFISTGMSDKNGFNLSKLENCRQVFGNSLMKAFLPICTSNNDGINFPTSIKQSLAASTQNYNANDSLLLNERQALNTSKKMMDQIRITME